MKKRALPLLLIILFGVLAYANTMSAPFQWDEQALIVDNSYITGADYFLQPSQAGDFSPTLNRRYLGFLSFALNYHIHGFHVTGYHVVNLTIHLVCAVLVYSLVLLMLRTPFMEGSRLGGRTAYTALFASLVFIAHPVQTEAVTYVFQRLASLTALFYLLALVTYIRSRLSAGTKAAWGLYAISLASTLLAMKTKEHAFTLPVVLVLLEFLFFRGAVRRRLLRLVPFILTMLIIPVSLAGRASGTADILSQLAGATRGFEELTRTEYLVTQFRVVVTYLRLLLLPINQNIDYHYPVFRSLFSPVVLASFMMLAGLLAWGVFLIVRSRTKDPALRLAGFGVLWFFITLSVESSVIPIPMVMNEYRLYLPSVGVFLAAGTGLGLMIERVRGKRIFWHVAVLTGLFPLLLAVATGIRNETWTDEVRLWQDVVAKSPLSDRAHYNLANNYMKDGLASEAIQAYRTALRLNPGHAGAHNNLGNALLDGFRAGEAIEHFSKAIDLDPEFVDARNNLGVAYLSIGKYARAVRQFRKALELKPGSPQLRMNLGIALFSEGLYKEALKQMKIAEVLNPQDADLQFYLGRIYLELGDIREARIRLKRTLKLDLGDREAARLLEKLSAEE